ncbi:MAG: histidine kinase [Thermodesulfobacteriota bacterium]
MHDTGLARIERNIAQCRLLLAVAAPLAVYLDPTEPILRVMEVTGAAFFIDPRALAVMLAHLAYSVALALVVWTGRVALPRVVAASNCGDVLFGALVAMVTEGTNSPFYVYFLFAVLAAGLRGTRRSAFVVTTTSLALYFGLILVMRPDGFGFYLTRVVYLGITGYLVGFLGGERRQLDTSLQGVARSLHDGYTQSLAGVNLRLETCRELIRRGRSDRAFAELSELQHAVTREYDDLRAFVRALQGRETGPALPTGPRDTRFTVHVDFEAPLPIVEHALQIMLEGARNVSRHASASSARIRAENARGRVLIRIEDDGVGFPRGVAAPWAIASRAAELGGRVRVASDGRVSGADVLVELPSSV